VISRKIIIPHFQLFETVVRYHREADLRRGAPRRLHGSRGRTPWVYTPFTPFSSPCRAGESGKGEESRMSSRGFYPRLFILFLLGELNGQTLGSP
jgi:hypothetical protein